MAAVENVLSAASFADRVAEFLERVECRPADSEAEREAIYRLRYEAFLREGFADPDGPPRMTDEMDDLPNTWIFGLHVDGYLAGTIRLHVLASDHRISPGYKLFPEILGPTLDAGRLIVEPSKFAIDREGAQRYPELPYAISRICLMAADYFGGDQIVATVRREHVAFYKRVYLFRQLCPPRFSDVFQIPLHLVGHHYPSAIKSIAARYPFNRWTDVEKRAMFERGYGPTPSQARSALLAEAVVEA
jgi:hypothetical protein